MFLSYSVFPVPFFLIKILYLHRSILAPFVVTFEWRGFFLYNFLGYQLFRVATVFHIYSSFHCTRIECMSCFISPQPEKIGYCRTIHSTGYLTVFFSYYTSSVISASVNCVIFNLILSPLFLQTKQQSVLHQPMSLVLVVGNVV